MKYFIWDLDNCLADDQWRFPAIDWHLEGDARWARYNKLALNDMPHHRAEFALTAKIGQNVIFTNRADTSADLTRAWMLQHYDFKGLMMMRKPGIRLAPELVKEQMLTQMFSITKSEVVCAFDDHEPILQMYRSHGVHAVQLRIHSVDVYGDRPKNLL